MKPMNLATQKKAIREFKRQAKEIIKRMAIARDDLRKLVGEYEAVLEYYDYSHGCFVDGLDKISEII